MTKKHFTETAEMAKVIKLAFMTGTDPKAIAGMVALALHMGHPFNPRFAEEQFRKACGLEVLLGKIPAEKKA